MKTVHYALMCVALLTILAFAPERPAAEQGPAIAGPGPSIAHGVIVRSNGIVTIDRWACYDPFAYANRPVESRMPTDLPKPLPCPARIEIGPDVDPNTLICTTTITGQKCSTLARVAIDAEKRP